MDGRRTRGGKCTVCDGGGGGMERKRIGKERMDRKGMGRGWEEGEFKRSWMGRWIGNGKRKR